MSGGSVSSEAQDRRRLDDQVLPFFPPNRYITSLLRRALGMGIYFARSRVPEQWLYVPDCRTIFVWMPDLTQQPLSFITVILAHELGHAVDFDSNPALVDTIRTVHWSQIPAEMELSAFVEGFHILTELEIPIDLLQYAQMIEEPMGSRFLVAIKQERLARSTPPRPTAISRS